VRQPLLPPPPPPTLLQLQRCNNSSGSGNGSSGSGGGVGGGKGRWGGGKRGSTAVPAALQGRTATARNRSEEEEVLPSSVRATEREMKRRRSERGREPGRKVRATAQSAKERGERKGRGTRNCEGQREGERGDTCARTRHRAIVAPGKSGMRKSPWTPRLPFFRRVT